MALPIHAMSWLLFPGTAGEVTQNEGGRGQHQQPQSRASEGILQTKGKALPQALSFQERSATPQKNKALAEKRQKEGTMHCPWDQDLLPLWEAFPGRAPICATHGHASFQHPPPQLGSLDLVMEGQLQTQSCTPKIISRLPVDRTFRYTWGCGHTWLVSLAARV